MRTIVNALSFIQTFGIRRFFIELYFRACNYYYEQRLNVDTSAIVSHDDLGYQNPEYQCYEPVKYRDIFTMLNLLPVDKTRSVMLDYGAGKGRAVVAAATYPFKKIIGVEMSERLMITAKKNIDNMRHKKAQSIELIQTDAAAYVVPRDVNIIYFFNPFKGEILRQVMSAVYDSYKQHPRKIFIIYFNNKYFDPLIEKQDWIITTCQKKFYHSYSYIPNPCGIYETKG
jgi:16S rRNA G966 N2-methylase RsmD